MSYRLCCSFGTSLARENVNRGALFLKIIICSWHHTAINFTSNENSDHLFFPVVNGTFLFPIKVKSTNEYWRYFEKVTQFGILEHPISKVFKNSSVVEAENIWLKVTDEEGMESSWATLWICWQISQRMTKPVSIYPLFWSDSQYQMYYKYLTNAL